MLVDSGTFKVVKNLAADTSDPRTHARKVLDALEALIEGKASKDQQSYSIAGRSISRLSPGELLEWRDRYRVEVAAEARAEKIKNGGMHAGIIKVRF